MKVFNEAKCLETTMSINILHDENGTTMDAVDLSYEDERMMGDTRRMEKKLYKFEHLLTHIGMKVWALIVVSVTPELITFSLHESHLDG